MTQDPTTPGLEIFSKAWYDNLFEGTVYAEPTTEKYRHARRAAEKICRNWVLGNSSDPVLVAHFIEQAHADS